MHAHFILTAGTKDAYGIAHLVCCKIWLENTLAELLCLEDQAAWLASESSTSSC